MMTKINALEIRKVYFSYKNCDSVLNGIDVTVPKGGIYGLLGSSGCGKTTLLRCALGRLQPKCGTISLFGKRPGSKACNVPGPGVGYMPQELALYEEFTIEETLVYFGRLFGIKFKTIDSRIEFLIDLLQLPEKERLISRLSGGQKRRVSIATALLHNPPFLILDEPTVGVDLILREAIWKHLEFLCKNGLTVIVTTHYIEEARTSRRVGFMRSGRLLAEESPEELLRLHGLNTMEKVFLKLCQLEDDQKSGNKLTFNRKSIVNELIESNGNNNAINKSEISLKVIKSEPKLNNGYLSPDDCYVNNGCITDAVDECIGDQTNGYVNNSSSDSNDIRLKILRKKRQSLTNGLIQLRQESIISQTNFILRLFALTLKNFKQMSRNLSLLAFFVLLPSIEILLLNTCIGQDVRKIPVSVYNPDSSSKRLGEMFLNSIDDRFIELLRFETLELAIDAVERNDVWAVIYFNKDFSYKLLYRFSFSAEDEETMNKSSIHLRIDMSNQVIGSQIHKHISDAFSTFIDKMSQKYETSLSSIKPIIITGKPIYGEEDASFNSFIVPGALVILAYFATTIVTCHLLIKERTDGLVERSLVAGVKPLEFVISHIILQVFILILQVGLKLLVAFLVISIPNSGSFISAIVLIFLQGMCGLMFGLMLSAVCPDEIYATTLCIGAFFPTVIVGGIFWPLESMPTIFKYFSQVMPSSLAIESLRSILTRGWGLTHYNVVIGFVVTILWLLFFLINALTFFMKKL